MKAGQGGLEELAEKVKAAVRARCCADAGPDVAPTLLCLMSLSAPGISDRCHLGGD